MTTPILDVQGAFYHIFGYGISWMNLLQVFSSKERMHLPAEGEKEKATTQFGYVSTVSPLIFAYS
jgi:hypothetical protein